MLRPEGWGAGWRGHWECLQQAVKHRAQSPGGRVRESEGECGRVLQREAGQDMLNW